MTFPTRIRYALRLLAYLAMQEGSRRVPVSAVANDENISVKYLEQIVGSLRPLDVLSSSRGARGGYRLVKDPADLAVSDIFTCLGGMAASVPCLEPGATCVRAASCTTRAFWLKMDTHMREFLEGTTLADLVSAAPPEAFLRVLGRIPGPRPALIPSREPLFLGCQALEESEV